MKIWHPILLSMLLVAMPVLSACDLLGIGNSREKQQQEYYRQQLEAIQKVQEANQKAQEEYNRQVQQGLKEWEEAYRIWLKQQQEQQIKQLQQVEGMPTDNQS
jgi:ABC-type transport system involved in cytochrome bd biosynthesis fused ATPase/permease subunit